MEHKQNDSCAAKENNKQIAVSKALLFVGIAIWKCNVSISYVRTIKRELKHVKAWLESFPVPPAAHLAG